MEQDPYDNSTHNSNSDDEANRSKEKSSKQKEPQVQLKEDIENKMAQFLNKDAKGDEKEDMEV